MIDIINILTLIYVSIYLFICWASFSLVLFERGCLTCAIYDLKHYVIWEAILWPYFLLRNIKEFMLSIPMPGVMDNKNVKLK